MEIKTDLVKIEKDLALVTREVEACRRIITIPGAGLITATALVASMRNLADFKSGRHFVAKLGLVPRQDSTGGFEKLGSTSKRSDRYLRKLLIHDSRSVMRWRRRSLT